MEHDASVWVVRAGRDGEREQACLDNQVIIAGWAEINKPFPVGSISEIRQLLESVYEDNNPHLLGNWAGQIDRFVNGIKAEDFIIMPRKDGTFAIGTVKSNDYLFNEKSTPGFQHQRKVEWQQTEISRNNLAPDFRKAFRCLLTVFRIDRENITKRVTELINTQIDPGPELSNTENSNTNKRNINKKTYSHTPDKKAESDKIEEEQLEDPQEISIPVSHWMQDLATETETPGAVDPNDSITVARTKMLAHNYSQLAVLQDGGLVGTITLDILTLQNPYQTNELECKVKNLMQPKPPLLDGNFRILDATELIEQNGYAFVELDDTYGIITVFDIMKFYKQIGNPLTSIREFEQSLKQALLDKGFSDKDIRRGNSKSIEKLTLGAYPHILKDPSNWERLNWTFLDKEYFLNLINKLARLRNSLAHWSLTEVSKEDQELIQSALRLIRLVTHTSTNFPNLTSTPTQQVNN